MDFTAIDFETASHRRDSACQLAAVVVRGGEIVGTSKWLIRPRPLYFTDSNVRIHGITAEAVQGEPEFGELWPEIWQSIRDDCLVAHNASFDLGVLLACLRTHRQSVPDLQFACTRAIAKRAWPGRRSYGLKPVSNWLGIRFRHHDALEDSLACAKLLIAAGLAKQAATLDELEEKLRLRRGSAGHWGYQGAGSRHSSRSGRGRAKPTGRSTTSGDQQPKTPFPLAEPGPNLDLQRLLIRAEFVRPLAGKRVVFTGQLRSFSREFAETLAHKLGGICQSTVSRKTDLVVVGSPDQRTAASGRAQSVKEERARRLQHAGESVQIVDEKQFLSLFVAHEPSNLAETTENNMPASQIESEGRTAEAPEIPAK